MACLLQIQTKRLQPNDGRDELLLIPLDALDRDGALRELVGLLGLGGLCLCRLLLGVPGGSLLGVEGQVRGGCLESLCRYWK